MGSDPNKASKRPSMAKTLHEKGAFCFQARAFHFFPVHKGLLGFKSRVVFTGKALKTLLGIKKADESCALVSWKCSSKSIPCSSMWQGVGKK